MQAYGTAEPLPKSTWTLLNAPTVRCTSLILPAPGGAGSGRVSRNPPRGGAETSCMLQMS